MSLVHLTRITQIVFIGDVVAVLFRYQKSNHVVKAKRLGTVFASYFVEFICLLDTEKNEYETIISALRSALMWKSRKYRLFKTELYNFKSLCKFT
jgi:hypothetical protein